MSIDAATTIGDDGTEVAKVGRRNWTRWIVVLGIEGALACAAACGGDDAGGGGESPDSGTPDATAHDATMGADAPIDVAPDRPISTDAGADAPDAARADAGDAAAPIDASDAAPALDASEAGALVDAGDAASAIDAADGSMGPAQGCFHFAQGGAEGSYFASAPRMAASSSHVAQVWTASPGNAALFARFDAYDAGFSGVPVEPIYGAERAADVARNGASFASVYASEIADAGDAGSSIFFATFDSTVAPDAGVPAVRVGNGNYPLVARGVAEFGLAWFAGPGYGFARMSAAGALLDAPQTIGGNPILVASTNGTEYGVVYVVPGGFGMPGNVQLARFAASDGHRIAADVTLASYLGSVAAGATGDGYVLAFGEALDGGGIAYELARFDAAGARAWTKPGFVADAVAWTGSEYGLLYFTTSGSGGSIQATAHLLRYTAAGDPIPGTQNDPLGIANPYGSAQLLWTGSRYAYAFLSDVQGFSREVEIAIDCFVGNGLPIP